MLRNTSFPLAGCPSTVSQSFDWGPAVFNGPDAHRSTKGLIRQDSIADGACGSSGEECFGIAGCPGYRTLGCLKNRCGACCRAMDICKFHEEADAKKAAIAAKLNL